MGKSKTSLGENPEDSTLLNEFEENVKTVVRILENSKSIIDERLKEDYSGKTDPRFIAQKTSNAVISILESFNPFGDLFPEILRFLNNYIPNFKDKVEGGYSNINDEIEEIVGKCGQDPLHPPSQPVIPYSEMCKLKRYIELLGNDLRFCVRAAKEEQAKADLANLKPAETEQNTTSAKRWGIWLCIKRIPHWIYYILATLAALLTVLHFLGLL